MSAIAAEFEYLIARARREKNPQLEQHLARAYEKFLDEATR